MRLKPRSKIVLSNYSLYYLLLITTYIVLIGVGLINHEMWRDELEAWLIARDSNSISELFSNLTFTGHPALWYLILYLLTRITHNPVAMQAAHFFIAVAVISLFVFSSPFNNLQKTLFCFSYFPLYEYGVISRSYSLGILLLFTFCILYCRKNQNCLYLSLALTLACQVSIYSLIISFFLALILLFETLYPQKAGLDSQRITIKSNVIAGFIVYLLGLLTGIMQIISARTALTQGELGVAINNTLQQENPNTLGIFHNFFKSYIASGLEFEKVINGIWRSYIPVPNAMSKSIWGTNFLTDNQQFYRIGSINSAPLVALFFSLALFILFTIIFSKQLRVLFIYVGGTLAIYAFGFIAKVPALRHNGHLFMLLIICCWLSCYYWQFNFQPTQQVQSQIVKFTPAKQKIILTIILFIQFYAGLKIYSLDIVKPFSNLKSVASFIKQNQLEGSIIVGTEDSLISPLSAWLDKEIYYPEINDFGTYTVWTPQSKRRNSNIDQPEIMSQIQQIRQETTQNIILVTSNRLLLATDAADLRLIASFEAQSLNYEEYFIYLVN